MDHPTWVDDERAAISSCQFDRVAEHPADGKFNRPLWVDVSGVRHAGERPGGWMSLWLEMKSRQPQSPADDGQYDDRFGGVRYVDHEFDSGHVSPVHAWVGEAADAEARVAAEDS